MEEQEPSVKWDIRCFHYERRKLLCTLIMYDLWKFIFRTLRRHRVEEGSIQGSETVVPLSPSIFSKKVVTHQTSQCYKFNRLVSKRRSDSLLMSFYSLHEN